jgi:uncharacterized membrane protein
MSHIYRSVTLSKDPGMVIDYIADVRNHPAFISALRSVSELSGESNRVGTTWKWTFVMAGVEIEGSAKTTTFESGKEFAYKTTGGVSSQFSYRVEKSGSDNTLVVEINYEPPPGVLGKIVDATIVERQNEAEADRTVQNLRTILSDR